MLKERREKKEENERYERLAAKMHAKKVERMRRREKRNKALKERQIEILSQKKIHMDKHNGIKHYRRLIDTQVNNLQWLISQQ